MDDQSRYVEEVNEWIKFGMRLGVSAALHPFEYSKVLIQLGYEPVPPRPGKTIFGHPVHILPNIFQYASYIKSVDGFTGCFRGVTPKIIGSFLGSIGSEKIAEKIGLPAVSDERKENTELSDDESFIIFKRQLKREIVLHASGLLISQPFHVISVRMMAQFIGRETRYVTIFGSIKEIWNEEGIFGFFSGFVPKLFFDISCVVLASSTAYYINKMLIHDSEAQQYTANFAQFVYASILYPLNVVSTCMSVTGARLKAGALPHMPIYHNWYDCWNDLQAKGELKRGSSLFWRYYRPMPIGNKIISTAPLPELKKYK